jgi:hypothetical protein
MRNTLFAAPIAALFLAACAVAPADDDGGASAESLDPQTVLARAQAISDRCTSSVGCFKHHDGTGTGLTWNETEILFAAAEIRTGISARLLKAIAYGEGLGDGYIKQKYPRQFYDLDDNPYFGWRATWAKTRLGLDVPLSLGIDVDNPTYGIGIMQLTADRGLVEHAIAVARAGKGPELVQLYGGGRPYTSWPVDRVVRMDVMKAIDDPYYNVLKAAELIAFKRDVYTDVRTPIHWVKAQPANDMDWALLGSTYQVYGGIGPGGGATTRIYNRMTNHESATYRDAWAFVNGQPTL